MPVRAGWVPCVGIQPPKPMVVMIEEADAIAEECERAYQHDTPTKAPATPSFSESESPRLVLQVRVVLIFTMILWALSLWCHSCFFYILKGF